MTADEDMTPVDGWRAERIAPKIYKTPAKRPANWSPGAAMTQRQVAATHLPFRAYGDDGIAGPAFCDRAGYARFRTLSHVNGEHEVPHPDCQCGYRIVADLAGMQAYLRRAERQYADRGMGRSPAVALYRCRGEGTVVPSSYRADDPPSTFRVSHLHLTGPIWLPTTGTGRAAARFLARISPAPEIRYVPEPRRMTEQEITA